MEPCHSCWRVVSGLWDETQLGSLEALGGVLGCHRDGQHVEWVGVF